MTREDLIRLARLAVAGIHRPDDCANPVAYDPPEWVLEALGAAWRAGAAEARREVVDWVESGIGGPEFLQKVRDWMTPSKPPVPTPSSEKRAQRAKRKR